MIEIFLEFLFGLSSITGAKKTGVKLKPGYVAFITIWLSALLTLTLVFW